MRPDYSGRLAFIGVALPIVTIVVVMMFGGQSDPITIWLKGWSTLIAGLAAVVAAVMTVYQMRQTDEGQQMRFREAEERQEDRHRQLVRLTLRSDQLRAERATFPTALDVRIWLDDLARFKLRHAAIGEDIGELQMGDSSEVARLAFALQGILKRRSLVEATDLYSHRLSLIYDDLVARTDSTTLKVDQSDGGRQNFGVTTADRQLAREVLMDLTRAVPYLEEMATRLIELDQAYRSLDREPSAGRFLLLKCSVRQHAADGDHENRGDQRYNDCGEPHAFDPDLSSRSSGRRIVGAIEPPAVLSEAIGIRIGLRRLSSWLEHQQSLSRVTLY
ncbi:hypothetical protein ACVDG8_033490 [Mesorhizobium sp. ORM8.1]